MFPIDLHFPVTRSIHRVALELPCAGLTEPVRFDFISDIHLSVDADLEALSAALKKPAADLLLLGGDYAEHFQFLAPFFELCADHYRFVFAVLGNNDLGCPRLIMRAIERCGGRLLCDEMVMQDELAIIGSADPETLRPSLPSLPQGPCLLLTHSPDLLLSIPETAPVTIVAGHTHAGQIRIPGLPWWSHTRVGRRFGDGVARRGANVVFTGKGVGCSLLSLRNVPREIYEVTLRGDLDPKMIPI